MTIRNLSARVAVLNVAVVAGLLVATAMLRGSAISDWGLINPDEAELMAQARSAQLSPIPYGTWGGWMPAWVLLLAGLGTVGAPLTLAFAHLLSAVILALTASALCLAASRSIGRAPALVVSLIWWFPIALTFPVGTPDNFSALNTEYLPTLLVVASVLVPRAQLAARPWLFLVVGLLAGVAMCSKHQVAPLAIGWAAAQLVVLHPSVKRLAISIVWWSVGVALPLTALLLVMAASSATNWTLVDQMLAFAGSYGSGSSPLRRIENTFTPLTKSAYYLFAVGAVLLWLGWRSERRSNVARGIVILGGIAAVLAGPSDFGHYLILLFGAIGLALTLPVKPDIRVLPSRLGPVAVAASLAVGGTLMIANGILTKRWTPLTPEAALAAFSSDSVNRNPELARACPPGSRAMVWGWKNELYIEQDWQSTIPYPEVLNLTMSSASQATGEPLIRAGIEQADCVIDTTRIRRPECSGADEPGPGEPMTCLPARYSLPRYYPQLAALVDRQFRQVPIARGCDGCAFYVRTR